MTDYVYKLHELNQTDLRKVIRCVMFALDRLVPAVDSNAFDLIAEEAIKEIHTTIEDCSTTQAAAWFIEIRGHYGEHLVGTWHREIGISRHIRYALIAELTDHFPLASQ